MRDSASFLGYTSLPVLLALFVALPATRAPRTAPVESEWQEPVLRAFRTDSLPDPAPGNFSVGRILLERHLGRSLTPAGAAALPLRVLVVTVPDPRESSLDWAYDSYMESVRRALEASGSVIDRAWFPAPGDSLRRPAGRDTLHVPAFDALPGVLLFRQDGAPPADSLTLVYLVGEIPTTGVHTAALRTALQEREALLGAPPDAGGLPGNGPRRDVIRIVGPTFSGSSPSLRRALETWGTEAPEPVTFRVVSGAATAPGNADRLDFEVVRPSDGGRVRSTFAATVHSNDALMETLGKVMACLGIRRHQVALLVEATTGYGQSFREDDYLRVAFPMNISAVRSAYGGTIPGPARAPVFDAPEDEPRLPLSLDARARPRESPPPSSRLTPATVDLVLEEILSTLEAHRVRAVAILATDVRDKLFLASLLKQRLRDVRLVTFESNMLLLRPDYRHALQGSLVVSTYPLILENQGWTHFGGGYLPFSNEGAQGLFNALLMQLDRTELMVDYRAPGATDDDGSRGALSRPPVWLTAVGSGMFLPLRTYEASDAYAAEARVPAGHRDEDHRMGILPIASFAMVVWLFVGLVLFVDSEIAARREPGRSARIRREGGNFDHAPILIVLAFLLPLCLLSFLPPAWEELRWRTLKTVVLCTLGAGLVVFLLAHARDVLRDLGRRGGWEAGHSLPVRLANRVAPILTLVLAGLSLLYGLQVLALWITDDTLFGIYAYRALRLDGGASPLLPLLITCGTLLMGNLWHGQRVKLLGETRPLERMEGPVGSPPRPHWAEAFRRAKGHMVEVRSSLERVVPGGVHWSLHASIVGLVGVGVLAVPLWFRSQEDLVFAEVGGLLTGSVFNLLLGWSILAGLLVVLGSTVQLVLSWVPLRDGLGELAETPLASAFDRLPDRIRTLARLHLFDPPSPSLGRTIAWTAHERLEGFVPGAELGRDVEASPGTGTERPALRAPGAAGPEAPDPLGQIRPGGPDEGVADEDADEADEGRLAERLAWLADGLERVWTRWPELVRLRGSGGPGGEEERDAARSQGKAGVGHSLERLRQAEEVAAIEVVRYVDWVLRHLRRIALLLLFCLLFVTALLVAYPNPYRGLITLAFILLLVVALGAVMMVMGQLSQDEILSRVAGTTPGRISFNRASMLSAVVFVSLPILGLLGAEVPAVGTRLFAWVDPLLRLFTNLG